ncbi:hypothetical protein LXL04_023654 [Taraxacum kok-saghyz]
MVFIQSVIVSNGLDRWLLKWSMEELPISFNTPIRYQSLRTRRTKKTFEKAKEVRHENTKAQSPDPLFQKRTSISSVIVASSKRVHLRSCDHCRICRVDFFFFFFVFVIPGYHGTK